MTVTPATIDEAIAEIRKAGAARKCVRIMGGGTKTSRETNDNSIALITTRLNRMVEFSPGDMTCTVEAGMTLREMEQTLGEKKLRLPIDPPDHDGRATIGGVLATNDNGPLRAGYGTIREHIIGMSMILADGTLIKAGGKVVKNVAGYDLHRAFVGSHGSLGVIATATFKLRPIAEAMQLIQMPPANLDDAKARTAALLAGPTRPVMIDWGIGDGTMIGAPPQASVREKGLNTRISMTIAFEDTREAVDWQVDQILRQFPDAFCAQEHSKKLYDHLRNRNCAAGKCAFRAAIGPSQLADFFKQSPLNVSLHAHATGAMVHGSFTKPDDAGLRAVRELTLRLGGWIEWRDANGRTHRDRNIAPTAIELEKRLKQRFDAHGIFIDPPWAANWRNVH